MKRKPTPNFKAMTATHAAAALGYSERQVFRWLSEEDAPRNADGSVSLPKLIAWLIAREAHDGLNLEAERARLAQSQNEKYQLDLAERRGDLLDRPTVVRNGIALISAMRSRMRAIPGRLAPELSTPETYPATKALIASVVDEALMEISDEQFARTVARDVAGRNGGSGGPAAGTDGQPMGRRKQNPEPRGKRRARPVANKSRGVSARSNGLRA
jgi:hypothetical protein